MSLAALKVLASLLPVHEVDRGIVAAGAEVAESHPFAAFLDVARPFIPIPGLALLLYALWRFFGATWRELDIDAHRFRGEILAEGKTDLRPFIFLPLAAFILTLQEYYGGRGFFEQAVRPLLVHYDAAHAAHAAKLAGAAGPAGVAASATALQDVLRLNKYAELWGFAWWAGTRIAGYTFPFVVWRFFFPADSLRDMGLRTKGFLAHGWIYGLFLIAVLPAMLLVSREPDFGSYYPFYKTSSRSWFDFLAWEAMYFAQFFALEMFFRGIWLGALRRSFGSGAIFAMAVPYCMIHFQKPYLEVSGAIIAGIALGSLSMKTKSIYQGFLVHITVAGLMDWLALSHRHALPTTFWPAS